LTVVIWKFGGFATRNWNAVAAVPTNWKKLDSIS
jgi:hypothetical protein